MCLLIASSKKVKNIEWLSNGFDNNSHGAGFVFAHQGKLTVKKGFFTFEKFLKEYNSMPEDAPCLIHFRLSTGGKMNETNCHPFEVTDKLAFAHNGMFFNINSCKNFSDTYYFNELLLKPIFKDNPKAIFTKAANVLLMEFIGRGNKLAFLNHKGQIAVVNEDAGHIEDGAWFSNCSYLHSSKSIKKGLMKAGRTVKSYASTPTADEFNIANHPDPVEWLTDIFLDFKSAQEEERDKARQELIELQAIGD